MLSATGLVWPFCDDSEEDERTTALYKSRRSKWTLPRKHLLAAASVRKVVGRHK